MPPMSLIPTRRRSGKNSPAFRKLQDQLDRTKRNLRRRNAEVRDYRMETEGGHIAKAVTVTGGVVSSALLPGALKKPGTDTPMLTRNGRRAVRLGVGVPLAIWGRRYHPLASLFGWAFAGTEIVFSALEMAKRDESGQAPEYGYYGEPVYEVGSADDDDFFDEEIDEIGDHADIDEIDEEVVVI